MIAAVSGGSDSTALLILAHEAAARRGMRLVAATVDHGLRAEAGAEAAAVARLCEGLGVEHQVLCWTGPKPATGLQQAAREARHELLSGLAEQLGTDIVLTGHTADDQAETVAMRAARGAGRGLAGMAPATLFGGRAWFVRPLLGMRRADLRAMLSRRGLTWVEDPSNRDARFERGRLRGGPGLSEEFLIQAEAAAAERRAGMAAAGRLIAGHASMPAPGLVRLLADAPARPGGRTALRLVLAALGGVPHLPAVEATAAALERLAGGTASVTLSRCVMERRAGWLYLWREARDLPRLQVAAGEAIYDGRWKIRVPCAVSGLMVRAGATLPPAAADLPRRPARGATASEPVLADEQGRCFALRSGPLPEGIQGEPIVAPHARFLPDFDLAAATPLARLMSARVPPSSPWRGQIDATG